MYNESHAGHADQDTQGQEPTVGATELRKGVAGSRKVSSGCDW